MSSFVKSMVVRIRAGFAAASRPRSPFCRDGRKYEETVSVLKTVIMVPIVSVLTLLIAAALPLLLGILALTVSFLTYEPTEPYVYNFTVQNRSGHEMILKKIAIDQKVFYSAGHTLQSCPQLSSPAKEVWEQKFRWSLINPKGLSLSVYDQVLGREVTGKLNLKGSDTGGGCSYLIVYGPDGFQLGPRRCG